MTCDLDHPGNRFLMRNVLDEFSGFGPKHRVQATTIVFFLTLNMAHAQSDGSSLSPGRAIPWLLFLLSLVLTGLLQLRYVKTRKLLEHQRAQREQNPDRQQDSSENLQTYLNLLTTAQDIAEMGLLDYDIRKKQANCNRVFHKIFGMEYRNEPLPEDVWLSMVHPDDRSRARDEIYESLENRTPYDTQYRVVHPDGTIRWISSKARTFYDDEGTPFRMIAAVTDITDQVMARKSQKQVNEKIANEQRKRLEESERSRLALLGILEDQKQTEEELSRHRTNLKELVEEQTRTLRERTAELERFNKAMIGREKRIIELKVEINNLHRELEREVPYPKWTGQDPNE